MARGRFISNNLGESDKFAQLDDHGQRMLYMMLVTHADAEGRLKADTRWIRGKVLTYIDFSDEDIERAVLRMHDVGLVVLYHHDDKPYMQVVKFHDHNKVRRDKEGVPTHESPSTIPPLQTGQIVLAEPLRSGDVAATAEVEVEVQDKDKVEVQDKDKETTSSSADDVYWKIVEAWNQNCGTLSKVQTLNTPRRRRLKTLIKDLGSPQEAYAVMAIAAKEVSMDPFWQQRGLGFNNILADQRVVQKAETAYNRGSFDHEQAEIDRMLGALGGNDA